MCIVEPTSIAGCPRAAVKINRNALGISWRFVLAFVAVVTVLASHMSAAAASRWGKDYLPNSPVVTQDGKTFRFYDDLIKDKIVIISFLFTSCRDICPIAAARLSQLQERLGDRIGRDIFLYSISIDPENDTPDKLKQFANAFGAGPGWLFLTGIPEDIKEIRYKLGERSQYLSDHRNDVLLGNGATGEWQRDSALGDLERLVMSIQAMNPAWSAQGENMARTSPDLQVFEFKGPPGEVFFRKACAGCHTIGRGDRVGPDLQGVAQRRRLDWLTQFISNPEKMRARKDPIALALMAKYPAVRMPAFGVSEKEAADLIAYIEERQQTPPVKVPLEPFLALTTHQGGHLSTDDLKGRPLAIAFGFTHCPDVCPTTLLNWSTMLASLGAKADKLKVLFVSVDSERDTPELLSAYMQAFDPRITALTGSPENVAEAAKVLDAFYEKIKEGSGEVTFDHTVKTYLIDRRGVLAGTVDFHADDSKRESVVKGLLAD